MKNIETFQIRKIYAIANALGITQADREDELHTLVATLTGKESIRELTYREGAAVIARLEELQGCLPKSKRPKSKKELGMDAVAKSPFAWVTFAQGNKLIEMLKRYAESAKRKGEDGDGPAGLRHSRKP